MSFSDTPTLSGAFVTLEQLSPAHLDGLRDAVRDGELWKLWYTSVPAPEDVEAEVQRRLGLQAAGTMAPWVLRRTDSGVVAGMTTYMNIDEANLRLEIGSTWLAKSAHGTGINAEAKLLLLGRAFDELGCNAVEFRTHWHNEQSRTAIARLGARQDGVLRSHTVMPNGTLRDTVVFSILKHEWPAVRAGLEYRLAKHTR